MLWMLIVSLLACGDKEDEDSGAEEAPEQQDTSSEEPAEEPEDSGAEEPEDTSAEGE